jgi:hypothetical protein
MDAQPLKLPKTTQASWDRDGFFIRLTPQRKAALLAIAKDLPGSPSPIVVIDHGLDVALAMRQEQTEDDAHEYEPPRDEQSSFTSTIARIETQARLDRETMEALGRGVAERFHALSDLITAAMEPGGSAEAPSFESWLSDETARLGLTIQKAAIAKAAWIGKRRSSTGRIEGEFEVELVGADGKPLRRKTAGAARVRLAGLAEPGALASSSMNQAVFLVAQPLAGGSWSITAYSSQSDGSLGSALAIA